MAGSDIVIFVVASETIFPYVRVREFHGPGGCFVQGSGFGSRVKDYAGVAWNGKGCFGDDVAWRGCCGGHHRGALRRSVCLDALSGGSSLSLSHRNYRIAFVVVVNIIFIMVIIIIALTISIFFISTVELPD